MKTCLHYALISYFYKKCHIESALSFLEVTDQGTLNYSKLFELNQFGYSIKELVTKEEFEILKEEILRGDDMLVLFGREQDGTGHAAHFTSSSHNLMSQDFLIKHISTNEEKEYIDGYCYPFFSERDFDRIIQRTTFATVIKRNL